MKHIRIFDSVLSEDVVNTNTNSELRLVSVKYGDKIMKAVAIGYGSGPYYMEKYYIIEDIPYDSADFENVETIDPIDLIKSI